jgi:redox-sensitive bicupin YhaK (pirin superfamily)
MLVSTASLAALSGCSFVRKAATPRAVVRVLPASPTSDGAGVRLNRAIGAAALRDLDPFLLLDEFRSDQPGDYIKGFPDHPHRGFETVTIMLAGAMEHKDSVGNRGLLAPGSVQWMTAGRGIVHSELPQQVNGLMHGYQLWVNLPAAHKLMPPRYQDLQPGVVPTAMAGDATARVLAGAVGSTRGPVDGVVVAPTVLDATVPAGGRLVHELPGGHTAVLFVIDGALRVGGVVVPAGSLGVLGPGDVVIAEGEGRALLLAGAPIGEPIARRGPFVMNTEAELDQAVRDYRSGRLVGG